MVYLKDRWISAQLHRGDAEEAEFDTLCRIMRFEYYSEAIAALPKLSVDGTVDNSIHFSHWQGNTTPAEVKADTSTEIALNLVASPNRSALTQDIELVTNNHFDTDGALSVWSVLAGERALDFKELLIDAAEAGDFSEYSSADGVRVSLAIQGSDGAIPEGDSGSPFARLLAGSNVTDDARTYELVLPEIENLLSNINKYESLWRDGWKSIEVALESFASGASKVVEQSKISLVTLAPDIFGGRFSPTKHSAPFTAISNAARGELFVIAIPTSGGWFYRIDYPYYSWAETVVRPRIERRDLSVVLRVLNEDESGEGSWKVDNSEMTSAAKFLDDAGLMVASNLEPDTVVQILLSSY